MTVINDPGNQSESYSDSAVRQWRTTAGLWKTDATDPNNTGTYAWSRGAQLWRATAQQWNVAYTNEVTLYNTSQANLATMTTNYNNSQTALGTMTTNYNNEVAAYTAALAAVGGVYTAEVALFGSDHGAGYVSHSVSGQTTIPKTGDFLITYSANQGTSDFRSYQILIGGTAVLAVGPHASGYVRGTYTAGQSVGFQSDFTDGFSDTGGRIYLIFCPTAAHPS